MQNYKRRRDKTKNVDVQNNAQVRSAGGVSLPLICALSLLRNVYQLTRNMKGRKKHT